LHICCIAFIFILYFVISLSKIGILQKRSFPLKGKPKNSQKLRKGVVSVCGFFYQTVPYFVNYSRSAPLLRKNPVVPPFTPQYPPFSDTNWPTQDGAIHNGASWPGMAPVRVEPTATCQTASAAVPCMHSTAFSSFYLLILYVIFRYQPKYCVFLSTYLSFMLKRTRMRFVFLFLLMFTNCFFFLLCHTSEKKIFIYEKKSQIYNSRLVCKCIIIKK
jgi:hypothetical protein